MRIMIDTNVLISAILFPGKGIDNLVVKVAEEHILVLSTYIIDELKSVIDRKFPGKIKSIEKFLTSLSYELEYSPKNYDNYELFKIRDENDYLVLLTAVISDVDIFITGDKDFQNIDIQRPEIMTPREFLEKY